jgi:hypothetical protein
MSKLGIPPTFYSRGTIINKDQSSLEYKIQFNYCEICQNQTLRVAFKTRFKEHTKTRLNNEDLEVPTPESFQLLYGLKIEEDCEKNCIYRRFLFSVDNFLVVNHSSGVFL